MVDGAPLKTGDPDVKAQFADIYITTGLRNHDGVNVLFTDGHAKFVSIQTVFNISLSNDWVYLDTQQ